MHSNKTIFIIGILTLILTASCTVSTEKNEPSHDTAKTEEAAQELKENIQKIQIKPEQSAEIYLTQKKADASNIIITVMVKNSKKIPVQSVRSWLSYNPKQITAVKIDTTKSSFETAAPTENNIEPLFGLIKIGRSTLGAGILDADIEVAKIVCTIKDPQTPSIMDFFDYQSGEEGHTQIQTIQDGQVFNILKKPLSPALIIQ